MANHGLVAWKPILVGRLLEKRATSLSDDEIVRCFADCVASANCIRFAIMLRDQGGLTGEDIQPSRQEVLPLGREVPAWQLNAPGD